MTKRQLPDDVLEAIRAQLDGSPMQAHLRDMLPEVRPTVSIRVDEKPLDAPRVGGTHLRGVPDVPPGWQWPTRNGARLALLAQFDCEEFEPVDYFSQLPHHGVIAFFYDLRDRPWGDEPDATSAAVVHYFPDTSALRPAQSDEEINAFGLKLFQTWELPSQSRWFNRRFGHLDQEQQFADYGFYLDDIVPDKVLPLTGHQLLGHATREQDGDLELRCELRRRGLGDGPADPARAEIERAADDWILLAQFAFSDERLVAGEHGDGYLSYFIRQQDLREQRFAATPFFFEVS